MNTTQVGPNLVLIGFMATGKSTIGRLCARELGFHFRDTDALIARRAGKSIPEIFANEGEAAFRARESAIIRDLARRSGQVIATGGGVVLNTGNVAHLRRGGVVILLSADPEEIALRAGGAANRPLLADSDDPRSRILEMLQAREPYYRTAAHRVVDTTGLVREDSAERVLAAYRDYARSVDARPRATA